MDQTWQSLLNGFFDKIIVITIDRAKARHKHILKAFEGLDFEFYFGTDKLEMDQEQIESGEFYNDDLAKRISRYSKSLSPGEIACSLSHRGVYEEIVKKGYARTLIFEDDVIPIRHNMVQLPSILREWPEDAGIIYLGYWRRERWSVKQKIKTRLYLTLHHLRLWGWHRFSTDRVKHLYIRPYSEHFNRAGFHDGAHAYAVSLEAAKALLETQTPVAHSADHLLSYEIHHLRSCQAYVSVPKIFNQVCHVQPDKLTSIREEG